MNRHTSVVSSFETYSQFSDTDTHTRWIDCISRTTKWSAKVEYTAVLLEVGKRHISMARSVESPARRALSQCAHYRGARRGWARQRRTNTRRREMSATADDKMATSVAPNSVDELFRFYRLKVGRTCFAMLLSAQIVYHGVYVVLRRTLTAEVLPLCLCPACSCSYHIFSLCQLNTLTIHNSLSLSLQAQDLPLSEIFPTIDSFPASGLTPRTSQPDRLF